MNNLEPAFKREDLIELTRELVLIPSVLGNEGQVARLVKERMDSLGFDQAYIDSVGNTVGVVQGRNPGPTIVLDAHMDTVDVVPREHWTRDPFGSEIADSRLYGRGTSDMKGALAAMILSVGSLSRDNIAGTVVVSASVNEESIEGVALQQVMAAHPPDFVIIGEASNLNLVRAGRGRAEYLIETRGVPAHASSPSLGTNAVHGMLRVINEIEKIQPPVHPIAGPGVMCLTDIISDPYPAHSVLPSGCRSTYERRLVPGETQEQIQGQLEQACVQAGQGDATVQLAEARVQTYTGYQLRARKWFPPWVIEEDHELVLRAMSGLRDSGLDPQLANYQFCTNAAYSAGVAGVPTIGFGPSSETLAHISDEYIEVEQLVGAAVGYSALCRSLLKRH